MSGTNPTTSALLRPASNAPGSTLVSLVAAKAGREIVWVIIAGAFLVVEGLVFLTELPAAKLFHRRDTVKVARAGRP